MTKRGKRFNLLHVIGPPRFFDEGKIKDGVNSHMAEDNGLDECIEGLGDAPDLGEAAEVFGGGCWVHLEAMPVDLRERRMKRLTLYTSPSLSAA